MSTRSPRADECLAKGQNRTFSLYLGSMVARHDVEGVAQWFVMSLYTILVGFRGWILWSVHGMVLVQAFGKEHVHLTEPKRPKLDVEDSAKLGTCRKMPLNNVQLHIKDIQGEESVTNHHHDGRWIIGSYIDVFAFMILRFDCFST